MTKRRPAGRAPAPASGPEEAARLLARVRELQEALKESEERYQSLLNNAHDIIYFVDLEGRFVEINKTAERLTGYTAEEVRGRPYSLVVAPESLELTRRMVAKKIAGGGPTTYEIELVAKDGHRFPIELSSQLRYLRGRPVGIQGIARDISERRRAEHTLRSSEAKFLSIFDSTPTGVIIADDRGTIIFWNSSAEQTFGYTGREVFGQPISMLMPLRYRDDHRRGLNEVRATGRSRLSGQILELHGLHKDGREFPLELSLTTWTSGDDRFYCGFVRDITERRQAEERLRREVERTSTLVRIAARLHQSLDLDGALPAVCDEICRALDVPVASISLYDEQRAELRYAYGVGLPAGVRERIRPLPRAAYEESVGQAGGPVVVNPDVQARPGWPNTDVYVDLGLRTTVNVSMLHQGRLVGRLNVGTIGAVRDFTEDELGLLRGVADQAAAIIVNGRLYQEVERRARQLQALRDIDMAISGSLDLRVTLNVLLEAVTSLLRVDAAAVLLYNDQMHSLEFGVGRGFRTAALQHTHLRLGEGYAGRAALERRTVRIEHLALEPGEFSRAPLLAGEEFVSYIGVPLIAKGAVKGVLEIFHRTPLPPAAVREWQEAMDALTGQAAIAIDNAALFGGLQRSNLELALAYDTTLEGWSRALDLRDSETEGHSQRVTEMTLRLARALAVQEDDLPHVRRGALLHDIGKIGVPDALLLKPGPLTEEEWEVMRRHPVTAYELLSPVAYLRPALDIPYCHHEKWDGTGYPRGLRGESIPLAARIFAVADVWDALRSDRPYRRAWSEERARAYIAEQAGAHFDPQIVEAFLRLVA